MSWFHRNMLEEFQRIERETYDFQRMVGQYQLQGSQRLLISRDAFNRRILDLCNQITQHMRNSEGITGKAVFSLNEIEKLTLDQVKMQTGFLKRLLSESLESDIRELLNNLIALRSQLRIWEQELLTVIEHAKLDYYDITQPALSQPFSYKNSPARIVITLRNIQELLKKLDLDIRTILPQHPGHYFSAKLDHYDRQLHGLLDQAA